MPDPLVRLLVGPRAISSNESYDVLSPEEPPRVLHSAECLADLEADVAAICQNAHEGFLEWSSKTLEQRLQILERAAANLRDIGDQLAESLKELGFPAWFSGFNSHAIVEQLQEYTRCMTRPTGEQLHSSSASLAFTERVPVGAVLSIAPWNAPAILAGRTISAPLAAGCSVVFKTSELAPLPGYFVVKAFHDAGVPIQTLQLVNVAPADNARVVRLLIEDPVIRKVSFTGSTAVGRQVAQVAGANLKPCILELGGKNVSIIEKDADLAKALPANLWGSWGHKGQICMSTDKIYVHEDVYDEFLAQLPVVAESVLQDKEYYLPQRSKVGADKVASLIADALDKGASVIYGDVSHSQEGNHPINPLVLANVSSDMKINSEETFGPVVCVIKYTDAAKEIHALNLQSHGLKASIWSKDILKAHKLARLFECGGVHINSPTVYDEATTPHGGVKGSGYGRFNSKWGIEEFTYVKLITMSEM